MNKKTESFLLKLVEQNYEAIAEEFNESRKRPMKEMIYKITESLEIKEGDKVLDLGCGNACFFEVLPLSVNYLGIDNSEGLIRYCKEKYGERFLKKNILEVNRGDFKGFKYIFSWAVFHHIPGKRLRLKFLKEIYQNLDEGSHFVFSVWKLREKKSFLFSAIKTYTKYLFKGIVLDFGDLIFPWGGADKNTLRYYHAFSKNSLKRLVGKTEFKVVEFLEDEFNYYFVLKK